MPSVRFLYLVKRNNEKGVNMLRKLSKMLLFSATVAVMVATLFLAFASKPASADTFSAGIKSGPGGAICTCPVMVGDCVCHIPTPLPGGPLPKPPVVPAGPGN